MISENSPAPDFTLKDEAGRDVRLSSFKGKTVVLYFYPKDETPGCTREACAFRDAWADVQDLGVVVLGVSKDSIASHKKFQAKHRLPFPLLSDPDGRILEAYGAFKEKTMWGKTFLGIERSTFLIDGQGVVRKVWRKVKVDGHADAVLAAAKEIAKA